MRVEEEGKQTDGTKYMCHRPEELKKWQRKES
jgi:hypothetical protein